MKTLSVHIILLVLVKFSRARHNCNFMAGQQVILITRYYIKINIITIMGLCLFFFKPIYDSSTILIMHDVVPE